ncbi:MAG: hypothetical protein HRJ53_17390, partial [Acidobacteria bacterium Pan2503]|nr:hypothetical protein [Candidatus Acidoferrum panamensis]
MNLQSKAHLCAVVSASVALFLFPLSAGAQVQRATESFDGLWLTDGYGELIEVQGDNLRAYEITTLSCLPAAKATRRIEASTVHEIVFAGKDGTLRISPGPLADTRWLHEDGSVSNILIRRAGSRPELCDQPPANTPLSNYQVFWETFSEHYPFFAQRQMNWPAVDKKFRPQVTPETKPEELF